MFTASSFDVYVASLYFIVQTMTTVGYGDISSNNQGEYVLNIFLKLAGVVLFSLVQSFVLNMIGTINKNQAIIEKKMGSLNRFQH